MTHRPPTRLAPLLALALAAPLPAALAAPVRAPQDPQPAATLTVQNGHSTGILQVLMTPDGRFVITVPEHGDWLGSMDQFPMVWDTWSGRQVRRLGARHLSSIRCADLSPDGARLLTGDDAGGLWSGEVSGWGGREVRASVGRDDPLARPGVLACAYVDGEGLLASVDGEGVLTLFEDLAPEQDPAGRPAPRTVELGPGAVADATPRFSEDGHWLFHATGHGTVVVRRVPSAEVVHEFEAPPGWLALRAAPDGSWFALGTEEGVARLWRAPFDEEPLELGVESPLYDLHLSPDAGLLMHFDHEEQVTVVWDTEDGELLGDLDGLPMGVSVDGLFAFSTPFSEHDELGNHTVRMHEVEEGEIVMEYRGQVSPLTHVALSGNGRVLVTADLDGWLDVWDLEEGLPVDRQPLWRRCGALSLSDDGRWLAVSARPIESWDPDVPDEPAVTYLVDQWDAGLVREFPGQVCVLSGDGRLLVTGDEAGRVVLWDVERDDPLRVLHEDETRGGVHTLDACEDPRRLACGFDGGTALVLDLDSGATLMDLPFASHVDLSPDGQRVAASQDEVQATLWTVGDPNSVQTLHGSRPRFLPDGRHLTARWYGSLLVYELGTQEDPTQFFGFEDLVEDVVGSRDGRWMWAASRDGTLSLFDLQALERVGRLVTFQDEFDLDLDLEDEDEDDPDVEAEDWEGYLPWAVLDESGRFDAANGGWVDGLHWVLGDEVVALEQLAEAFYQPGLLTLILDPEGPDVREVVDLAGGGVGLHPEVRVERRPTADDPELELTVVAREGGGIGRVALHVNGVEFLEDARDEPLDPSAERLTIRRDLRACPQWRGDGQDVVEAVAFNGAGTLRGRVAVTEAELVGRGGRARARTATVPAGERGRFLALVVGVADYAGEEIDLSYADRDARAFGRVIRTAAERFHGADRVQVTVLEDEGTPATRAAVLAALDGLAASTPDDTVLIYMAGHGVTREGEYHFLLSEASGFDLSDDAERARVALSASELTSRLKAVPALRRVLILDTCNSGQLISNLVGRGAEADRALALQRLRERSGTFVLAGSAADQKAYESNRFGQGLLTYSLLLGMTGKALREEVFVDVHDLFTFAQDQVPQLARGAPGSQRPQMSFPGSTTFTSFDIGELQEGDRGVIQLRTGLPIVMRTDFQLEGEPADPLRLTDELHDALKEHARADGARLVFLNDHKISGAYRVAGRYAFDGDAVEVKVFVYLGQERVGAFEVRGTRADVPRLAGEVLRGLLGQLP